ncbi:MAG: hypothetical protein ACRD98_00255 [Nitrososphaera sp.]
MAVAASIGAGLTLASGIGGALSSRSAAGQQGAQAQYNTLYNRNFLQGREAEVAGLFRNLQRMGAGYADVGADVRARSMAQLLGLFGGRRMAGQRFSHTVPGYQRMVSQYQPQGGGTYKGITLPSNVDPQKFAQNYERYNAVVHKGKTLEGHKAAWGETGEWQQAIQEIMSNSLVDPASAPQYETTPERTLSYDVNVPTGGGLFDDIQDAHDRYFEELSNFSSEEFAQKELDLYRNLARPEETRQQQLLQNTLFGQGRLGTTGGAGEQGRFQEALGQADTARILQSIAGGRNEQGRLYGLAFSPEYQDYLGLMQNLYSQYYGGENAAVGSAGAFQTGVLGQQIDQFNNYTNAYLQNQQQGQQSQMQALQNQAAATQGLWSGLGQFGGGLAQSGLLYGGGGGWGSLFGGGSRWGGIPYKYGYGY